MAKKVAFLLFPGFEMLDFYGPLSIFGSKRLDSAYRTLTVSETAGPVPSSYGVATVTEYDFLTCPKPDILLVSGECVSFPADVMAVEMLSSSLQKQAASARGRRCTTKSC